MSPLTDDRGIPAIRQESLQASVSLSTGHSGRQNTDDILLISSLEAISFLTCGDLSRPQQRVDDFNRQSDAYYRYSLRFGASMTRQRR